MNESKTKIQRPKTAGVVRCQTATSTPQRPSSHQYRKTKRSPPVERPPVPAWMLDTPLYSKVPMVAAPAGKIMLYTTGLCEKLHETPRGFDFDSCPQGLIMTYSSLHDPNLRGYHTTPRMYSHLMKSGFLTPCGMVKCSLKQFNEYHQYMKQVQLEQLTQQRKHMKKMHFDPQMHTQHHKPTHKKRAAPEQVANISSKHRWRSSTKSLSRSSGQVKTGGVSKLASKKGSLARSKTPGGSEAQAPEKRQHKPKRTRRSREMKAYERQSLLLNKRFDEEMRCEQELERKKLVRRAQRELKLQEQWDRREANREAKMVLEASQHEKEEVKASKVKIMRSKMVEARQAQQKAIFESIRDARAQLVAQRETIIAKRLEKRLAKIRRKYNRRYKRQWGKAALKHLITSEEYDEVAEAEGEPHREDDMYSSDDITAALERTKQYLSSTSLREKLSPLSVSSSSSDKDAVFTSVMKEQPELTIIDQVLSVTSLDYRKSPKPETVPKEEPGGTSMMRDVYLADDSGKEDGCLQGAGAVSPGIPAISSGMASSSASVKSTSRSSSDSSVGDESLKDEESAVRKEQQEEGKEKGEDSEDLTSEDESEPTTSPEKPEEASSEETDFWKSESEASLQEESLSSFSEEEEDGSKDEVGIEEDLVEEILEVGEAEGKDESEKKIEGKTEAAMGGVKEEAEKREIESKQLTTKQEEREHKRGTEQVVETVQAQAAEDKLEPEKKEQDEKSRTARDDKDDEVLEVLEENLEAEKDDQEILEQNDLQEVHSEDAAVGVKTEDMVEADQVISAEIQEKVLMTEDDVEKDILARKMKLSSEKQGKQGKDQELEQKIEVREELQNKNVEETATEEQEKKFSLEAQQEVIETDTKTEEKTEMEKENRDERAERDEEKKAQKQGVSKKEEPATDIEEKVKETKDKLKQTEEEGGKVDENGIIRQASGAVASVIKRSISQLSTECPRDHEERMADGQQVVSQEASGVQDDIKRDWETAELASDSVLLANVMGILEEVEHEIHHHHHHEHHEHHHHENQMHSPQDVSQDEQHDSDNGEVLSEGSSECDSYSSSSSESGEEEGEIIGVVENEIIAVEGSVTSLKGCLSGEAVPGLTEVVKETEDHKIIFEGALMPLKHHSSTSTASSKVSINVTAAVLSAGSLKMDSSGRLKHDMASHTHIKASKSDTAPLGAAPPKLDKAELTESSHHHYSSIVPIYHDNLINVGEELIDTNLSAISMKPDRHHKIPSSYSTGSRNSFRNIFRPDMTYCQGSAKCLKDTLVKELSHSKHSKQSSSDEMNKYYDILEEEQEDVTAHHSEEELVTADDSEGVCYLPKRRTYKVHHPVEAVVLEQEEISDDIQSPEVLLTTKEDKKTTVMDSFRTETLLTQETETEKISSCTESPSQVVEEGTRCGDEHNTSCDAKMECDVVAASEGSCGGSWVMVESGPSQQTQSKVHADLDKIDGDLTRADGRELEAASVDEKPGPHEESIGSDLHKAPTEGTAAPTEGHADARPDQAVSTADRLTSEDPTTEMEAQDHETLTNGPCELDDIINGQAREHPEETGNSGIVETVNRPSSSTPTPEDEMPGHGGRSNGPCEVNITGEEVNVETRNFEVVENQERSSSSIQIPETEIQDQGVKLNGPCEINDSEEAAQDSSEGQDGIQDQKKDCEPDPANSSQSATHHVDASENGGCQNDHYHTANRPQGECNGGQGEQETLLSEDPLQTHNETADVTHPNNCLNESCLNDAHDVKHSLTDQNTGEFPESKADAASHEIQVAPEESSYRYASSAASLSGSTTLPISCGATPESGSSAFSDFDAINCPDNQIQMPLPNTVVDPTMNLTYMPAPPSPQGASNDAEGCCDDMSDKQGSGKYRADGYKSDLSSPQGNAPEISKVSSHPAVSESKSSSSRKSGSRMSGIMRKISSALSLWRKRSSRVHPGKEAEDEDQGKPKAEDNKENP